MRRVPAAERFWAKVDISAGPESCWPWQAVRDHTGYGKFWINGTMDRAHRAVFILRGQGIPDGLEVLHSCDNPPCVNPAHLSLGTRIQNIRDMMARHRGGSRRLDICPHGHELTGNNLHIRADGYAQCRECGRRVARAAYWRRRAA